MRQMLHSKTHDKADEGELRREEASSRREPERASHLRRDDRAIGAAAEPRQPEKSCAASGQEERRNEVARSARTHPGPFVVMLAIGSVWTLHLQR